MLRPLPIIGERYRAALLFGCMVALVHRRRCQSVMRNVSLVRKGRWRLVTGCADGAVRVWSVSKPRRIGGVADDDSDDGDKDNAIREETGDDVPRSAAPSSSDKDDACSFIGTLSPPPNVATSNEKVASIHFHPNGRFVGVCRTNGKTIVIYLVRSEAEAQRKKTRRIRRRREKGGRKAADCGRCQKGWKEERYT